jgi:hypothetical protein
MLARYESLMYWCPKLKKVHGEKKELHVKLSFSANPRRKRKGYLLRGKLEIRPGILRG